MAHDDLTLPSLTVLIIEDEFLIAADVERIVQDAGAAGVLLASSVATARAFLDGGRPIDLAILDLKLGGEDGLPLAQELRDRRIPFVVATGLDSNAALPDAIVVHKPYNDRDVVQALVKALETGRQTQARA